MSSGSSSWIDRLTCTRLQIVSFLQNVELQRHEMLAFVSKISAQKQVRWVEQGPRCSRWWGWGQATSERLLPGLGASRIRRTEEREALQACDRSVAASGERARARVTIS
jgi:hypothetical protein